MEKSILLDLVKLAGQQARVVMVGLQQPLMPSWLYVDRQDRMHIVGTPWESNDAKEGAARHVRWIMRKDQAVAYSLVTEAWTATQPEGWKPDQPIEVAPRDRPDRKEVVIAFATDGEHIEWKRWAIKRDWTERVVALEEEAFEEGPLESWLTQLLK